MWPIRVRNDRKFSDFARFFSHEMGGACGGGRRYCGERVGAMRCIFGVGGRVEDGGVREEKWKRKIWKTVRNL